MPSYILECRIIYLLSSLYVCMAIKYIIVLFVETPRKFITAVINLRGVSTNKTIIYFAVINLCGVSTNKTNLLIV